MAELIRTDVAMRVEPASTVRIDVRRRWTACLTPRGTGCGTRPGIFFGSGGEKDARPLRSSPCPRGGAGCGSRPQPLHDACRRAVPGLPSTPLHRSPRPVPHPTSTSGKRSSPGARGAMNPTQTSPARGRSTSNRSRSGRRDLARAHKSTRTDRPRLCRGAPTVARASHTDWDRGAGRNKY